MPLPPLWPVCPGHYRIDRSPLFPSHDKLQIDNESDAKIKAAQNNLNTLYDNFVKKNGYLNKQANKSAYKSDPDAPLLLALEKYDRDNKTAEKAAIFTKRTLLVQKKLSQPTQPKRRWWLRSTKQGGLIGKE